MKRRSKTIFEITNKISLKNNKEWIGWKGQVLFTEQSDGKIRGRNFAYKPVFVDKPVKLGDSKLVQITEATSHGLYGLIAS
jgi:tRNA A37 methylthiotransferase MiaB